jgi:peptide/nickel transport system permease protein
LRTIRRLATNKLAFIGGLAIVLLLLMALFAPWIAPFDPDRINPSDRFAPPLTGKYLFGADELGRDVLSRIIFGWRASLNIAALSIVGATLLGATAGIVAGYFGGWTDTIIMRITDVLFAIPTMLIALSVVGLFGRSEGNLMFALALGFAPSFARICYSAVLGVRESRFVEAARAMGASSTRILAQDILPNIMPLLMVQITIHFSRAMLAEAGLGFLGLGVMPPTPSWGQMISTARQFFAWSPSLAFFPGVALLVAVLAFNLFGDGLRDLLDPRAWQTDD